MLLHQLGGRGIELLVVLLVCGGGVERNLGAGVKIVGEPEVGFLRHLELLVVRLVGGAAVEGDALSPVWLAV